PSMHSEAARTRFPVEPSSPESRAPAFGWCAATSSRCAASPSGYCRTTARRSARDSMTARWSWPTPDPRCTTATRSIPSFPANSINREHADGSQYLGLVDPSAASLDHALGHLAGARLDELHEVAGDAAAQCRHSDRIGGGHPVR